LFIIFLVFLLTDKQTGENVTSFAEVMLITMLIMNPYLTFRGRRFTV